MIRAALPLDRITIASPCSASWDEMEGDDCVRSCDHCRLHVFNLSAMSQREAENLIARTEGRLCARFYQRSDGTVITKDCPMGLLALRRGVYWGIAKGAGIAVCFFAFLAGVVISVTGKPKGTNSSSPRPAPVTAFVDWLEDKLFPHPVMGGICPLPSSQAGGSNGAEEDCELDEAGDTGM